MGRLPEYLDISVNAHYCPWFLAFQKSCEYYLHLSYLSRQQKLLVHITSTKFARHLYPFRRYSDTFQKGSRPQCQLVDFSITHDGRRDVAMQLRPWAVNLMTARTATTPSSAVHFLLQVLPSGLVECRQSDRTWKRAGWLCLSARPHKVPGSNSFELPNCFTAHSSCLVHTGNTTFHPRHFVQLILLWFILLRRQWWPLVLPIIHLNNHLLWRISRVVPAVLLFLQK